MNGWIHMVKPVLTFYKFVNIPKNVNAVRISNLNHLWCLTVLCKKTQFFFLNLIFSDFNITGISYNGHYF